MIAPEILDFVPSKHTCLLESACKVRNFYLKKQSYPKDSQETDVPPCDHIAVRHDPPIYEAPPLYFGEKDYPPFF